MSFDGDPAVGVLLQECFPSQPMFAERDWWNERPRWRVKLVDRGNVVAYCSGIERTMTLDGHPIQMLCVGQVSTTESRRRRGLTRAALTALHAMAVGCDAAILTTNSPWVYSGLGYIQIERQLKWGMVRPLAPGHWDMTSTLDQNGPDW